MNANNLSNLHTEKVKKKLKKRRRNKSQAAN